ncbi:MAG: hypothetical protein QM644_03190 [Mobilitalea sp.]
MKQYVAPSIKIEHLELFESIAHNCWSGTDFFYDKDRNGRKGKHEEEFEPITQPTHHGCTVDKNDLISDLKKILGRSYDSWARTSGINSNSRVNATTVSNIGFRVSR